VAKKTYKQWVDFHLKKLRAQYPGRTDYALMTLAGDMASESVKKQGGLPPASMAESSATPVVGPRVGPGSPTLTPLIDKTKPTPAPTPKPTTPPGGTTYNDRMVARIIATGQGAQGPFNITYPTSPTAKGGPFLQYPDIIASMSDNDYLRVRDTLKILGYKGVTRNKEEIDRLLIQMFGNLFPVKNVDDLITKLKMRALPGDTGGEKADIPLRQISPIDRGSLVNFARTIVEGELKMDRLAPEVENKIVDDWMKKAEKGIVTMPTKKVRNPKTGKMENVVETKRAFDQQAEGLALADRLREMFPDQYNLAQGIDFASEVKKVLGGGQ
jgi:hypothetical protein